MPNYILRIVDPEFRRFDTDKEFSLESPSVELAEGHWLPIFSGGAQFACLKVVRRTLPVYVRTEQLHTLRADSQELEILSAMFVSSSMLEPIRDPGEMRKLYELLEKKWK